jgi:transposase
VPGFTENEFAAQKKTFYSSERDSERVKLLRKHWLTQTQPDLNKRRIWFLDETGVNLSLSREYARSFKGSRAAGNKPKNYGDSVTLLGAINEDGTIAALEVRGSTDETVILAFIKEILSKVLSLGDCVVLDNLSSHKTNKVQAAFAALGVEVYYLPPYSPDLNPIEMCWSKIKTFLKQAAARNYSVLSEAVSQALKTITAADASNWIRHCGYV